MNSRYLLQRLATRASRYHPWSISSTKHTACFSSSSSSSNNNNNSNGPTQDSTKNEEMVFERTSYVHPLSQVALEHLQDQHHAFVCAAQLDRGLTIHRDGSFELKDSNQEESPARRRIWTWYDEQDKKHWLTVQWGDSLYERFLLQDNLMSNWNSPNRKSLPERIQKAVDDLINTVQDHTQQQQHKRR